MQQMMLQNPDLMRQVTESPMFHNLMQNPEIIEQMLMSNPQVLRCVCASGSCRGHAVAAGRTILCWPQVRRAVEQNPELRHILTDPATIRQSMQV